MVPHFGQRPRISPTGIPFPENPQPSQPSIKGILSMDLLELTSLFICSVINGGGFGVSFSKSLFCLFILLSSLLNICITLLCIFFSRYLDIYFCLRYFSNLYIPYTIIIEDIVQTKDINGEVKLHDPKNTAKMSANMAAISANLGIMFLSIINIIISIMHLSVNIL